uniref:N-acetylmuramoyl-L-alanine amidase n=1 Tax=Ochrobactrum phage ORM_20 TaxID=2985243 RepID=A0A9N6WU06_9VIRU|nr:amidase [Ochrobactrum phage ORM_20]
MREMRVVNGKLTDSVPVTSTQTITYHNTTKKSSGKNKKRFIVVHYTAGNLYNDDVRQLSTGSAQVSCHIVIGRNGQVAQVGSFDDIQWHAGASTWKGINGLNSYSIGIELNNPGYLKPTGDGRTYLAHFGKKYDLYNDKLVLAKQPDVGSATYGWLPYTEDQLEALKAVVEALRKAFPTIEEVVGHEQISPGRKQDPGLGIILEWKTMDELNGRIDRTDNDPSAPGIDDLPWANRIVRDAPSGLRIRSGMSTSSSIIGSLKNGEVIQTLWKSAEWLQLKQGGYIATKFTEVIS